LSGRHPDNGVRPGGRTKGMPPACPLSEGEGPVGVRRGRGVAPAGRAPQGDHPSRPESVDRPGQGRSMRARVHGPPANRWRPAARAHCTTGLKHATQVSVASHKAEDLPAVQVSDGVIHVDGTSEGRDRGVVGMNAPRVRRCRPTAGPVGTNSPWGPSGPMRTWPLPPPRDAKSSPRPAVDAVAGGASPTVRDLSAPYAPLALLALP
jgi:hypothetical protein